MPKVLSPVNVAFLDIVAVATVLPVQASNGNPSQIKLVTVQLVNDPPNVKLTVLNVPAEIRYPLDTIPFKLL